MYTFMEGRKKGRRKGGRGGGRIYGGNIKQNRALWVFLLFPEELSISPNLFELALVARWFFPDMKQQPGLEPKGSYHPSVKATSQQRRLLAELPSAACLSFLMCVIAVQEASMSSCFLSGRKRLCGSHSPLHGDCLCFREGRDTQQRLTHCPRPLQAAAERSTFSPRWSMGPDPSLPLSQWVAAPSVPGLGRHPTPTPGETQATVHPGNKTQGQTAQTPPHPSPVHIHMSPLRKSGPPLLSLFPNIFLSVMHPPLAHVSPEMTNIADWLLERDDGIKRETSRATRTKGLS